jgi:hypothetical protein
MNFRQIKDQILRNQGYLGTKPAGEPDDSISLYVNGVYQGLAAKDDWAWWLGKIDYSIVEGQSAFSLPQDFSNVLTLRDSTNRPIGIRPTKEQAAYAVLHAAVNNRTVAPDAVFPFTVYNTGTVALANGGTTVTLTDGTWPATAAGRSFVLLDDPEQFIVASRTSNSQIELDHARIGAAVTASAYHLDKAGTQRYKLVPVACEADTWTLWYFFCPPLLVADADEPLLPPMFHRYLIEAPREFLLLNAEERAQLIQAGNLESSNILAEMKTKNRAQLTAMLVEIEAYA